MYSCTMVRYSFKSKVGMKISLAPRNSGRHIPLGAVRERPGGVAGAVRERPGGGAGASRGGEGEIGRAHV